MWKNTQIMQKLCDMTRHHANLWNHIKTFDTVVFESYFKTNLILIGFLDYISASTFSIFLVMALGVALLSVASMKRCSNLVRD